MRKLILASVACGALVLSSCDVQAIDRDLNVCGLWDAVTGSSKGPSQCTLSRWGYENAGTIAVVGGAAAVGAIFIRNPFKIAALAETLKRAFWSDLQGGDAVDGQSGGGQLPGGEGSGSVSVGAIILGAATGIVGPVNFPRHPDGRNKAASSTAQDSPDPRQMERSDELDSVNAIQADSSRESSGEADGRVSSGQVSPNTLVGVLAVMSFTGAGSEEESDEPNPDVSDASNSQPGHESSSGASSEVVPDSLSVANENNVESGYQADSEEESDEPNPDAIDASNSQPGHESSSGG